MSTISKITTAAAVAAIGLGLGASSASAYAINGISGNPFNYTGTTSVDHSYTNGGAYTITCPAALTTFSGIATGADSTSFTPSYGGTDDCEFFGLPITVTQSGNWNLTVTGGPTAGTYTGSIEIPSGTTTTISIPLIGCSWTVSGPQTFAHGGGPAGGNIVQARNVTGGAEIEVIVTGIAYTASAGCPFSSNNDGEYNTNGPVSIPGVVIS